MSYTLIQETRERLQTMNTVVASSITAWNLVDRLHRLSVEAYRYRESDWIDHQFYGLRDQNNTLSAILALNNDTLELPGDLSCLQIHGLYVHADYQRQGLGQRLIENAVKLARTRHLDAVFVKSHESAVSYFETLEFQWIPVMDEVRDYPYRLVRSLI
jgi:GNAT superfamily N-acetyltransferase